MAENVQSATFEILKSIQAKLSEHDRRFDVLEDLIRKQRRGAAGLLVMAQGTAGRFAEELAVIEERVRLLEARGG